MRAIPSFASKKSVLDIQEEITQIQPSGKTLSVDYLKQFSSTNGDSDYFVVTSNTNWQIISSPTWCTITPNYGTGNANVTVQVSANSGGERSGLIVLVGEGVIGSIVLPIIQLSGAAPASTLTTGSITDFTSAGETKTLTITSNTAWSVVSYPVWVTITPLSGFGNGSIQITAAQNTSGQRTGNIVLRGTGVASDVTIAITQTSGVVSTANYYVAPNGSDSNPGTEAQPYATLTKAWSMLAATETSSKLIYVRGGTYNISSQITLTTKNGSAGNLIKLWAYPGETPIFTTNTGFSGFCFYFCGSYVHFKGLEIKGFKSSSSMATGFIAGQETGLGEVTNNCIFENLNIHHNTNGFIMRHRATGNWIKNSDFHHNYSSYNSGNDSDGVAINYQFLGETNKISGCRAWNNGDDGIDFSDSDGYVECSNNWSWHNGYEVDVNGNTTENPVGDGHGYKLGWNLSGARGGLDNVSGTLLRLVTNCISYDNYTSGFSQQDGNMIFHLYNNTAYNNANEWAWQAFSFGAKNTACILRNNLSYQNVYDAMTLSNMTVDHNSWNGGVTVDGTDFISLDSTGLDGPRQADGSLPNLNFLKLRPTSDLINAGIDLGYGLNIGVY